jgi:hypothetical protein
MDNHTEKDQSVEQKRQNSKMHKKAAQIFAILPIAFCRFWV